MFTTINVISRNEDTQLYGAILPTELTNEDIRISESYKEYHAIASGMIPPKTKGSKKKADTDTTTKQKPPTAPKEKKEKKSGKGKQKTTELETISEADLTEAEQLKIITKRSRQESHSSHASGSGADEGTGVTPGVPDAPDYDSEDDISWKSSDNDQDDEQAQDDENEDEDDDVHDKDEKAQADDDEEQNESEDDGDDFIHPKREEVYKATTKKLDWINPEGRQYPHDLRQPLPLVPNSQGRHVIPFHHFINNDLEYLRGGESSRKYSTSVTKTTAADYGHIKWIEDLVPNSMWSQMIVKYDKFALWGISHWGKKRRQFYAFATTRESARDVYSKRRIIAVTKVEIVEWHNYKHLDWITVRRDDDILYKFKEGDFQRLRIQDIEDMLLLLVQGKVTNLNVEERIAFNVSLRMFTRSVVIQRRVEDLQLGVESYQKKLNLTKPDTDGTLDDVRTALNDRLKGIRMEYLPQTFWSQRDKANARAMIQAIDKRLKTRRIMRSLERFVGGRPYGEHAEYDESNTYVLERFNTTAGNHVKKILLKLNLSDHRLLEFYNTLVDLGASVSVMPLSTYLNVGLGELAHTKLIVELVDRIVKYPKGIAENVLVGIGKFLFPIDFIILDMLEDIKLPLILKRPFLSTTRAKIDVFKRKITLRVGEERIIFKSVKPASSLIKRVYMLSLRERMELDLEARLMGETLVLNKSLDPLDGDYIELNDLNEPIELRRNQGNDLMPTIEEGKVIEEFRTRDDKLDTGIDDYPSFEFLHANFSPILYVNVMSKKFHNSIMRDKMEYKGNNIVGALMNVPIFVGTFSVVTNFEVLKDMDAYRDEGMGDVIFGEPFLREVGINARRFDGMITIYNGNDEVTYQMVRSHLMFIHYTNKQCNKIPPLLEVSEEDKMNGISHSYHKLKGFYKGVLNVGPEYIRDAKMEEWLTAGT
ncbi:uncharacterized mitochondrial protein-like protein [Tanacetum coccineum]